MQSYLLGIDIGTSACKVALFHANGEVLAQATKPYPVIYPQDGWAEQDPDAWWNAICEAIKETLAISQIDPSEIAGIGVDGQSWSAIAIDADGNVLTNTPIWTDTRAQRICDEMSQQISEKELFELSGNAMRPGYTLPKVLWYKEQLPAVYEKASSILQSNGYIVYRLTGALSQDKSQGYGWNCYNMRTGEWDYEMADRLGIRRELLPPIVACDAIVGGVTTQAAKQTGLLEGTPVVAGGLDAACGTLGAGVVKAGQTQEQGGQAGGMSVCIDQYVADERLIMGAHVVPDCWLLQGGTTGGGGALKWLKEQLFPELSFAEMSELAETVEPGCNGVIFLPYMAGERSPIWNPAACGVFFGLSFAKTRAHFIRAVMEGVAYSLRHNIECAKEAGAAPDVLRSMGGAANSLVWTQIKSDVTGCTIEVPASDTASTWGAALLAAVATGLYANYEEATEKTIKTTRTHVPNPAVASVYDAGYQKYIELYTRLVPMMEY